LLHLEGLSLVALGLGETNPMAVSTAHTFAVVARLSREPDGVLRGRAQLGPGYDRACPGLVGCAPLLIVAAGALVLEADSRERPRWWMSQVAKQRSATCRAVTLRVGEVFTSRLLRPGDELSLGWDAWARPSMTLRRDGHCLFAFTPYIRSVLDEDPDCSALPRAGQARTVGSLRVTALDPLVFPQYRPALISGGEEKPQYVAVRQDPDLAWVDCDLNLLQLSRLLPEQERW
jgi:hypothetical protein